MNTHRTTLALSTCIALAAAGCDAGPTGPDEPPAGALTSTLVARIQSIEVIHDCDPAIGNPGDFRALVEIWQDSETGPEEAMVLLTASPQPTVAVDSDETRGWGEMAVAQAVVYRDESRPVIVKMASAELDDNAAIDSGAGAADPFRWSESGACWMYYDNCMGPRDQNQYTKSYTMSVNTRADVFDLFNPDDEGCRFNTSWETTFLNSTP
ncbi:MAG: hypothetical protein WEF86_01170 [Gemmatimonadota bacterium]